MQFLPQSKQANGYSVVIIYAHLLVFILTGPRHIFLVIPHMKPTDALQQY